MISISSIVKAIWEAFANKTDFQKSFTASIYVRLRYVVWVRMWSITSNSMWTRPKAFRKLWLPFEKMYTKHTPYSCDDRVQLRSATKRGRPRSMNETICLGLSLMRTRSRGSMNVLSMILTLWQVSFSDSLGESSLKFWQLMTTLVFGYLASKRWVVLKRYLKPVTVIWNILFVLRMV